MLGIKPKNYQCAYCPEAFYRLSDKFRHMADDHDIQNLVHFRAFPDCFKEKSSGPPTQITIYPNKVTCIMCRSRLKSVDE